MEEIRRTSIELSDCGERQVIERLGASNIHTKITLKIT